MTRRRLGFWRRVTVMIVKPTLLVWTRRNWSGQRHLPPEGGLILVSNHVSHFDPLPIAHFVYEAGRWPEFLAKQSVFDVPVLGYLLRAVRQIPVRRGTADAAKALDAAIAAVENGDSVVIYPEGTTTKEPDLWPMRGKTGVARLWLATGAPVVPIAMWGPEKVFDPRTEKLSLRPRMPMTVVAGPPVDLSKWRGAEPTSRTLNEITEEIMLRVRDLLAEVRDAPAPPLWNRPSGVDSEVAPGVDSAVVSGVDSAAAKEAL